MEDHDKLLADTAARHPDFDWDDFLPSIRDMASYQGKLLGIPYRVTASILNYQKQLLADAGITTAPGNWDGASSLPAKRRPSGSGALRSGDLGSSRACHRRRLFAIPARQWRRLFRPETWEILINNDKAVEALQFYGDLMTKYKVVVPDSITWEFDEIIAGGQSDRYAMTITLAPYGTLINDPKLSQTGGRWAWAVPPGAHSARKAALLGGWTFGVPTDGKNKEWAFEFIQMATSKQWMRRSLERGNAPPRVSVLNHPAVPKRFGWAPVLAEAMKTATLEPRDPIWPCLELQLRSGDFAPCCWARNREGSAGRGRGGLAAQADMSLKRKSHVP